LRFLVFYVISLGDYVTNGGGGGCPVVVAVVVTSVCRTTRYLPSATIRSTFPVPGMVGSDPIMGFRILTTLVGLIWRLLWFHRPLGFFQFFTGIPGFGILLLGVEQHKLGNGLR
jgi:hypothetical protein